MEVRNQAMVMRTSALTFVCLLAILAAMPLRSAPAQQPADVAACQTEKDRQTAIAACSRVIADGALPASIRSEALVRRALIYSLLSVTDFNAAVEIDPANPTVRKERAYHHFASGRSDQAIVDYNEAIRLDPNDAAAYRARGDVWLIQKKYSETLADYRKAIELEAIDSSRAWDQCRISASRTNAFFHCLRVADDASQPAELRADAQRRLDGMMGRSGTAR